MRSFKESVVERTPGVGASHTDLTVDLTTDLTVDLSDSCNAIHSDCDEQFSSASSLSLPQTHADAQHIVSKQTNDKSLRTLTRLPVRLEPDGGEIDRDNCNAPTTSALHDTGDISVPLGCDMPLGDTGRALTLGDTAVTTRAHITRSADSSPSAARRNKVRLTQYGFIDDASVLATSRVVGLREEQLRDIAANKPDRLNARVRRQNRIKRNSQQSPATSDLLTR